MVQAEKLTQLHNTMVIITSTQMDEFITTVCSQNTGRLANGKFWLILQWPRPLLSRQLHSQNGLNYYVACI